MIKTKKGFRIAAIAIVILNATEVSGQDSAGIRFEQMLQWPDILTKAKAEHKYIFADCYATWCGPCKQMDEAVYPLKEVGAIYNNQFISVKMQMDRTEKDNDKIKSRYNRAHRFETDYAISAYPTFLFFDENGNIVHKAVGARNTRDFMQLAADAYNPDKQNYTILKNYQPGKLDTAELKGLARSFRGSDKVLAGKLALDYLDRIPKAQLGLPDNGRLMAQFQDNLGVLKIAADYIASLNKKGLTKNLEFIAAIREKQPVHELAVRFIKSLNNTEFKKDKYIDFIILFVDDTNVQKIAQHYIERLSKKELYQRGNIGYLSAFTKLPSDRGFEIFYHHAKEIDSIEGFSNFAEIRAGQIISNAELLPVLDKAKKQAAEPDFETISRTITQKYNAYYAERIITKGKADWYHYLVYDKKRDQYWPQLTGADMALEKMIWGDQELTDGLAIDINNTCYTDVFLHSDDTAILGLALRWMEKVVSKRPNDPNVLDTYACLLYEVAGQTDRAIAIEQKVLQYCIDNRAKGTMTLTRYTMMTIEKMMAGEKMWYDKAFSRLFELNQFLLHIVPMIIRLFLLI